MIDPNYPVYMDTHFKAGVTRAQASLTDENAAGLTSRLVPTCSPDTNLSKGGLQMAQCGKLRGVRRVGIWLISHGLGKFSILKTLFLDIDSKFSVFVWFVEYTYTRFKKRCNIRNTSYIYNIYICICIYMCIYRDFVKQGVFALLAVYFCFFVNTCIYRCA